MSKQRILLCDIGNTNFHFCYKSKMWNIPIGKLSKMDKDIVVYYISVNKKAEQYLLKACSHAFSLGGNLSVNSAYKGLGIDRNILCKVIKDGVIIDAGTAISVDIMQNGVHLGGFLYPGFFALSQCYSSLSPVLKCDISFDISFDMLPQGTQEAINYGAIGSIVPLVEKIHKGKNIYITGTDGLYLSKIIKGSHYDKGLIFKGIMKVLKNKHIL